MLEAKLTQLEPELDQLESRAQLKLLLMDLQVLAPELELKRLQAGPVLEEQEPMVMLEPQQGPQLEIQQVMLAMQVPGQVQLELLAMQVAMLQARQVPEVVEVVHFMVQAMLPVVYQADFMATAVVLLDSWQEPGLEMELVLGPEPVQPLNYQPTMELMIQLAMQLDSQLVAILSAKNQSQ